MHKSVFFSTLAVVSVFRFDEVRGDDLQYWNRDRKYDELANSLNVIYGKIHAEPKFHRLHSAQRRWEKMQIATAMENIDRWSRSLKSNVTYRPVVKTSRLLSSRQVDQRRHMSNHSHGPHHRWKMALTATTEKEQPPTTLASVTRTTTKLQVPEQSPVRIYSDDSKEKYPKFDDVKRAALRRPVHLAQEEKPHTTENPKEVSKEQQKKSAAEPTNNSQVAVKSPEKHDGAHKKEQIILSPYSLYSELKNEFVPKFPEYNITLEVVGRTVEYNDLILMKVTEKITKVFRAEDDIFEDDIANKKVVFIVHGLSVMGFNQLPCMKTLDSVVTLYSYYFKHLDKFDIYIMPMANPDGVAAAVMKSFWNKNMSPQANCPGVALDRNFDIAWNDSSSTLSSCGQQYPGVSPFTETETKAVRDIFLKYGYKMIAYFNVHAGTYSPSIFKGDAVLYPKGFTDSTSDDDKYIDLRSEVDEMMRNANFKVYSVTMDTLYSWYGKVYGTSVDYAAVAYGVPFAMELVMQLYDDDMMVEDTKERETDAALTETWSRLLDVIFSFMHRTQGKNAANLL